MARPTDTPAFRYRAFISYSHQDKAWAAWLHKALETYRVPTRLVGQTTAAGVVPQRLLPVFRDRDELASATDLGSKVNEALAASDNLIVICSPRSANSRWVNEEVLAFKRLGRSDRLFCLIVDGEPHASAIPGREGEECFANALRFRLDSAGSLTDEPTEPIAADARPGKDGRTHAKLKLIAGLLDVGFDQLRQREQQRHQRRLAAVTALALLVTATTSTLAVMAVRAQRIAEHERNQAESLVGFMLGDLHTKLEAVNHLDILDEVAGKAMGYFGSLSDAEMDDTARAERAQALQLIGRVRQEQGKLADADRAFEESVQLMRPLVASHPDNAAWAMALADSYAWLGNVAWDREDLDRALSSFREAAPLVTSVVHDHPDNLDWFKRLGWLHNNIGHVLQARRQWDGAQQEFETVLATYRSLVARAPDNRRYRTELAHAYDNLAEVELERGSLVDAQRQAHEALARWNALAQQDPKDDSVQMYMARAEATLATLLQWHGDLPGSTATLHGALDVGQRLRNGNPDSAESLADVAGYELALARLDRLAGQRDAALPLLQQATADFTRLTHMEAEDPAWKARLAACDLESARLAWLDGDQDHASLEARQAQATANDVLRKHPGHVRSTLLQAESDILLGRLAAAGSGDPMPLWRAALATLDRDLPATSAPEPVPLALRAQALCLLGRDNEATPIVATLDRLGYRDSDYLQSIDATRCRTTLTAHRDTAPELPCHDHAGIRPRTPPRPTFSPTPGGA